MEFPKCFIINLKKDKAKKAFMEKELKDFNPIIIDAINGKSLNISKINKDLKRKLTHGEVGCAKSHILIYKRIIKENIKKAIIFEDDIILKKDFKDSIFKIISKDIDFDIILLGHYSNDIRENINISKWYKKRIGNYSIIKFGSNYNYGAHGYLISLAGAKKLINKTNPLVKPIDHYTGSNEGIKLYGIDPVLVDLNPLFPDSDLEKDRAIIQGNKNIKFKKLKRIIKKIYFRYKLPI
jgi:glycosyl transferase family 25